MILMELLLTFTLRVMVPDLWKVQSVAEDRDRSAIAPSSVCSFLESPSCFCSAAIDGNCSNWQETAVSFFLENQIWNFVFFCSAIDGSFSSLLFFGWSEVLKIRAASALLLVMATLLQLAGNGSRSSFGSSRFRL